MADEMFHDKAIPWTASTSERSKISKYQPKDLFLLLFRIAAGIIILELIHQSHLGYYTVISLTFSVLEMHG